MSGGGAGVPTIRDLSEAEWEVLAMETLAGLDWEPKAGSSLNPGSGERTSWSEPILVERLRSAVARINPKLPSSAVDDAVSDVVSAQSGDALAENKRVHDLMTRGLRSVSYVDEHGARHNPTVWLVDFRDVSNNDYLIANQVSLVDGNVRRRLDVVAYLNGLPVAVIELKRAGNAHATIDVARAQLRTYLEELPLAFRANAICVVSDGVTARYGTVFTPYEHFAVWNVDHEGQPVPAHPLRTEDLPLPVLLEGIFEQRRFLDLLRGHVTFAQTSTGLVKRVAKAHQYFAVTKAVRQTVKVSSTDDPRAGVVWHTQGSGKSLEMELYAYQVMTHPALGNPTIVVLTDRTDLDDQLYESFLASQLLPETPVQVTSREQMRAELSRRTVGGILFSTLQKFGLTQQEKKARLAHPLLSDRRNVIVIVDEAHRSHYDTLDGYARRLREALPKAKFIAFTGTPVSLAERDTRNMFGDYIDVYDLTRAVDDGATVRIYHESRLAPLHLPSDVDPSVIDERADELFEGMDEAERKRVERSVATLNEIYGAPGRLRVVAEDLVAHWEQRSSSMRPFIGGPGKAMIVCATRNICARLYAEIVTQRPGWHSADDDKGRIKVVYTGEPGEPDEDVHKHIRRPSQHKLIQRRAKDPDDELEIVIVQSMWLTGFDSPPLHTLYLDKPMRGAALMQALARVNRTFRDKPSGLLVGYAPIIASLHEALAEYTPDDQKTRPIDRDISEAIAQVRDAHAAVAAMLTGHDWREAFARPDRMSFVGAILGVLNYLRDPATPGNDVPASEPKLDERFRRATAALERLFTLCSGSSDLNDLRDDIAFFVACRVWLAKSDAENRRSRGESVPAEIEHYLRQYQASIIEADGVKDVFAEAGLPHPDVTHLDGDYLDRLRASKRPSLAVEALRRVIEQAMRKVTRHNVVRQQTYSERLQALMNQYANRHLTAAEVIQQLAAMAKEVVADGNRGKAFSPELSSDELAFYDAVAANESAVTEMGVGTLADIARDLVKTLRNSVSVDWTSRSDVRAKLRSTIRRLLARYGYPPDAEPGAVELVVRQMETFADEWVPRL